MSSVPRSTVGNLPSSLTTFVGRRRESTETRRRLTESRLVTLTGVGGVGKTRLAQQVAGEVARDFPDGAWFVELGEVHEPELVLDTVAAVFGLHDQATTSPLDLLVDHLADRDLLIVLDNCEHVVDAAAKLVDLLLRDCPRIRILATSRESLGVGGEAVERMRPLPVPDPNSPPSLSALSRYESITLFADRARSVHPDFAVTEDNRVAIARICHRLDGLPLPIELAAARVRVLSVQQILDRLTDRFRLLTAGRRLAPTRQQTLRLSVDWSYELCTQEERLVWTRLSVFSGGFELDAVEGACARAAESGRAVDFLASLVDKSILVADTVGAVVRYGMLETLREYGREKLGEAHETTQCRTQHRDWYLGLAEQAAANWIGPRQAEWVARLTRENANLRDALEFCATEPGEGAAGLRLAQALFPFWHCRGMLGEGRRWYARMVTAAGDSAPPRMLVDALCASTQFAMMQEDSVLAGALVDDAGRIAATIGDPAVTATVDHTVGRLSLYRGDMARALGFLGKALPVLRATGDVYQVIRALSAIGLAYGIAGDVAQAQACHEEVLEIARERDERQFRAQSMFVLGLTWWMQGQRDRATRLFSDGLPLSYSVADQFVSAGLVESLAWSAAHARQGERGAVLAGAAERLRRNMGVPTVLMPAVIAVHDEFRRECHRLLGDRAFDAAFATGLSFGITAAVDYALGRGDDVVLSRAATEAPTAPMRIIVPSGEPPALTRRERQVADLVARGLTNREIAETLVIAQRTAEGHVERVLGKLGFGSRTQIAAWVAEQS